MACSRCTPLWKGVQGLHAFPRTLHAMACKACTPFGQACRLCTPVGSRKPLDLRGLREPRYPYKGTQGTLIRVLLGTLIRVPGTLIRVPLGTLIRVPGTLIRVPWALIRVPLGTLIRVPRYPYKGYRGTLIRVPLGTLIRVPRYPYKGTTWYPYKGTEWYPYRSTGYPYKGTQGTLIRVPGTLIRVPGTLIRVPGTLIRVPGTLIRVPNGTLIRVPSGTLIRVPNGTLIRVPSGTLIRVPNGTLIRVPSGTLIRVPNGTLIRVPSGTLIRVPGTLGTLIRAPRGSRKPLDLRGLREPGRTGVHGQHACPAGPHAEPVVLTPFVGVRTACGMRRRACGGVRGGVRTPFGRAAIKPPAYIISLSERWTITQANKQVISEWQELNLVSYNAAVKKLHKFKLSIGKYQYELPLNPNNIYQFVAWTGRSEDDDRLTKILATSLTK
ncbi:hypothetical protein PCANC_16288 [Puccinia coronata f. sp. avenae]|uniref:Uncharacterized protein n=1 Tax=Puccinia coronata f. sp. avenae TaxID=200324 RepID=A0A2N5UH95_9BASI|nr:hypothetical protein PCANC_16288 [Puccinia coronata f. sp. avenae]